MPVANQLLPEEESFTESERPVAVDTTVKLTGIPEIDELLIQVTSATEREKLAAYVYSNLIAKPKLTIALSKRAVYTVLNSGGKFEYSFSNMDIAWLARSLHGEGGPECSRTKASALSWTMFNRFMLNPRHFGTDTFWVFLQGFSQPINPKWRSDGKFCVLGGKYHDSAYCSANKLLRRDRIAYGPIPPTCLGFAEEMAVGTLEQPPKIYIDFASYKGMDKYGDKIGGDNFLTAADDAVRLQGHGKTPMAWSSGKVTRIGVKNSPITDVIEPRKKSELLAYLTNYVMGEQRATVNQVVSKGEVNSSASAQSQTGATAKLQQVANAVQMITTIQATKIPTFSEMKTGGDGFQVGSDDTWNRV
jgi:hypothetical protein